MPQPLDWLTAKELVAVDAGEAAGRASSNSQGSQAFIAISVWENAEFTNKPSIIEMAV